MGSASGGPDGAGRESSSGAFWLASLECRGPWEGAGGRGVGMLAGRRVVLCVLGQLVLV
jgi:hypothetical protein